MRTLSKLDLTKRYWQIPLTPSSWERTAFAAPQGLFQFTHMPFGLHMAAANFQRLMATYIDNIIMSWVQHLKDLVAIFYSYSKRDSEQTH